MQRSLSWLLLLLTTALLLSACPVSARTAGEQVGGELRRGREQTETFLQGVEKGYADPSAPSKSIGQSIGRMLNAAGREAGQFLQGVQSGYKNR